MMVCLCFCVCGWLLDGGKNEDDKDKRNDIIEDEADIGFAERTVVEKRVVVEEQNGFASSSGEYYDSESDVS